MPPDLPNLGLYLHWEERNSRCYAEFKKLDGYQRTKSRKFDKDGSVKSKISALEYVFEYINTVYHLKFTALSTYKADWRPSLG